MEVALFDYLASEYDRAIDVNNNLDTVAYLIKLIQPVSHSKLPILDFGVVQPSATHLSKRAA